MTTQTMGSRLKAAMKRLEIIPADLARRSGASTATISNWLNDNVVAEHVKAEQLFRIADAAKMSARELLLGESDPYPSMGVAEPQAEYASHPMQLEDWIISFQLVAEALDDKGLTLPPAKRAEVTLLAHDLLTEGMPRAKVLRFVQAAAA